jgi:hypothetical protein
MSIIVLQDWTPLVDDATAGDIENMELAAVEVFTQPVPVGSINKKTGDGGHLIELRAAMAGAKVGASIADNLTLNLYRAPERDVVKGITAAASERMAAYLRSSEPFATQTADVSAVADPGSDLITTGDFASDATWVKGNGWTISGGKGNHSQTAGKGEISQPVTLVNNAEFLLTFDIPNQATDMIIDVWAGAEDYALKQHITRIDYAARLAADNARLFRWLGTGAAHDLRFIASNTGTAISIDNVVLKQVVPYRIHNVQRVETVGSAIVYGFLPGADYASTFLTAHTKVSMITG